MVEQVPVLRAEKHDPRFRATIAHDFGKDRVLRLTYTANDMAPLTFDLGYDRPPFSWEEKERATSTHAFDSLHFLLYGFTRKTRTTCSTPSRSPPERRATFVGYRTREMILRCPERPCSRRYGDVGGRENRKGARITFGVDRVLLIRHHMECQAIQNTDGVGEWILDFYGMKASTKKFKTNTKSGFMRQYPHLMIRGGAKSLIQQAMKIDGCGLGQLSAVAY